MAQTRSIVWRLVPVLLPGVLWLAFALASLGMIGVAVLPGIAMSALTSFILLAAGLAALGARRTWVIWAASALPAICLACAHAAVLVSHWLESQRPPRLINGHEMSISQEIITIGVLVGLSLLAMASFVAWEVLLVGIVWILERLGPRAGQCRKCRYNRAGIAPDAKCPECGSIPSAT